MATKKKAAAANSKAPTATEKKVAVVKAPVSKPAKTEMLHLQKHLRILPLLGQKHTEMAALSNTVLLKTRIVCRQ